MSDTNLEHEVTHTHAQFLKGLFYLNEYISAILFPIAARTIVDWTSTVDVDVKSDKFCRFNANVDEVVVLTRAYLYYKQYLGNDQC